MFVLLLAVAASGPVLPNSWSPKGEARTVIDRQLRSPPRENGTGGLSPEEADAIMAHYLASIGATMDQAQPTKRSAPQQ
jgi:hypothetical protein